jgi:hypothetical protein
MMDISYKMGFLVMGIILFVLLTVVYLFFTKKITILMQAYTIKKSKIHGQGLFANKFFKKSELIFDVDISKLPTIKPGAKLSKEDELHIDYAGN